MGKSSLLSSLFSAFTGKPPVLMPIRKGETEATVEVDLNDILIRQRCYIDKEGKTQYEVKVLPNNKSDFGKPVPYKRPQELLDKLYSKFTINLGKFIDLDDKEQLNAFQQALGLDVSEEDAEEARLIEERKDAKKEVDRIEVRNAGLKVDALLPDEEKNAADLIEKLSAANTANAGKAVLKAKLDSAVRRVTAAKEVIEGVESDIARLERDLAEKRAELTTKKELLGGYEKDLADAEKAEKAFEVIDTTALSEELAKIDTDNAAIRENKRIKENLKEYAAAEAKRAALEQAVEDVRKRRKEKIVKATNEAQFAVPGVEIIDGALWVDGIPFKQCNLEKKYRLTAAIAVKGNPTLRVFRLDDGEKITPANLEILSQIAKENDCQIWIEQATTEEDVRSGYREVELFIREGEIADDVKPVAK